MTEFIPAPPRVPVRFVVDAARATWRLRHAVPTPRVRSTATPTRATGSARFGVTVDRTSCVLRPSGDFDLAAVDHFTAVAAALTGDRCDDLTVDLAGVEFIDAAGMGALVVLRNALTAGGRQLRVQAADARTRRLFDVAGLSGLL